MSIYKRQVEWAKSHYGIESWGKGFFSIDADGDVCVHPSADASVSIKLQDIIKECEPKGIVSPLILRFPQVLDTQLKRFHEEFRSAIWKNSYSGEHFGVFPFKVNQRREFIDAISYSGFDYRYGLEVGSKTEFMAALSYDLHPQALFICNGFKDKDFIELCFMAKKFGKNIIVVVEGPDELQNIVEISKRYDEMPGVGFRVRLYSRGAGKWAKSSGNTSKFGLSTNELLDCLKILSDNNCEESLQMLHFHNGSQITEIKKIKKAVKEAIRVYAKVYQRGFKPKFLNVGGGIGVDYDGSKTSFSSSANYSIQEFANDTIYTIGEVCKEEEVPMPNVVTESGRIIAAYHSVVLTDIREVQSPCEEPWMEENSQLCQEKDSPKALKELFYIYNHINEKNYIEYYHDSIAFQDELFTLFDLGYINLSHRALGEKLVFIIANRALECSLQERHQPEEFSLLQKEMVSKYLANFSIFQSIPDSWAIDQLFPILPLSRHHEKPSLKASIVDITCDSDGCLEQFIGRSSIKRSIDLHKPNGSPYFLGFFLVGAYQESLANEHNLFGAIHEAEVLVSEEGKWRFSKLTSGDPIDELLVCRNYDCEEMMKSYKKQLTSQGHHEEEIQATLDQCKKALVAYPYLKALH